MTTRSIIIEYGTMLESVASTALIKILGIKKESSESFGSSSKSLSFNSKFTLIGDLVNTNTNIKKKFQLFAEIRNKFAHVFEVDSFNAFCALSPDFNKKGNYLLKLYTAELENEDIEFRFQIAFILLARELIEYVSDTILKHEFKLGFEKGKRDVSESSLKFLLSEGSKTDEGREIIKRMIEENIKRS